MPKQLHRPNSCATIEDDSSSVPFDPEALCERLFSILLELALRMQEHRKSKTVPRIPSSQKSRFFKSGSCLSKIHL